jgi:hypothetical protein
MEEVIQSILIVLIVGFVYFFPGILAFENKHHNKSAILVFNIFLGWTVLGWIIALVWSCTNSKKN